MSKIEESNIEKNIKPRFFCDGKKEFLLSFESSLKYDEWIATVKYEYKLRTREFVKTSCGLTWEEMEKKQKAMDILFLKDFFGRNFHKMITHEPGTVGESIERFFFNMVDTPLMDNMLNSLPNLNFFCCKHHKKCAYKTFFANKQSEGVQIVQSEGVQSERTDEGWDNMYLYHCMYCTC